MTSIKHPARHYFHFLLSRRTFGLAEVIKTVDDLGIPCPGKEQGLEELTADVQAIQRRMEWPLNFNPRERRPNPSTEAFLARWGIRDAWQGSSYVAAASDLLAAPAIRYSLELMLLGPMSAQAVSARIAERYDLPDHAMNAGVVRAYGHYFWDQNSMSPAQWRRYITEQRADEALEYLAALSAPRSVAGAAFIVSIADKDPQLLGAAERYEAVSALGFRRFLEHALSGPRPADTYAAFAALNIMKTSDVELDKYRGGSTDLIKELQRMQTVYDKTQPLKITAAPYIRPILDASVRTEDGNE